MELLQYYRIFRRWLWLVVLAAFVGGSMSFISRVTQSAVYRTQTTISIGNYLDSPNPTSQEIGTGQDLALTYAEIARTYDVLNGVVQALDLPFDADKLNDIIDTRIISGTSLLQISVTYTDPVLAADITNELATQLILSSPTNLTPQQQTQVTVINEEIAAQRNELITLRDQLRAVDVSLDIDDISEDARLFLQNQRSTLVDQINDASSIIAEFTNTIASFQQRTNSVEIIESARIPTTTIGSSLFSTVILGTMVGAALAFGGVLAFEYVNDTFRSADELTQLLNMPVLGVITKFGKKDNTYSERLITNLLPVSQVAEEYRTLRANVLFTTEQQKRIFIISSASPQEGKSVTSSNLAASMALAGLRVLLIDADMRRPKIHEVFGLPNLVGLSNLLVRESSDNNQEKIGPVLDETAWKKVIQRTKIPDLYVITNGFTPHNPSELLGSTRMKLWLKEFVESPHIDVIIFDCPPALAVSDSAVLAATIEANVILVVQAGRTRRSVALKAKERFTTIDVNVIGAVLNGANLQDEDYYGYNYGYYYANNMPPNPQPEPRNS